MHFDFTAVRALAASLLSTATLASAHSVKQKISAYDDNQGLTRQRVAVDLGLNFTHSGMISSTSYAVDAKRDLFRNNNAVEDEYARQFYGGGDLTQDSGSISATQTWNKLTDTRVMGSVTTDERVTSKTGSVGVSRWLHEESIQLSLDLSRTSVTRPVFEILGRDSDIISPPPMLSSNGVTAGVKHLATPTTMTTYGATHIETNDRPPTNIYSAGVKQFIPAIQGAVHADLSRAFNRGRVTNASAYGEVDAWLGEVAYLQSLWRGGRSRLAYRYYREDEVTQVNQDELVLGSDTVSLSLAQDIPKGSIDNISYPLSLEASGSRYNTNEVDDEGTKISASVYEVGVNAQF